MRGPGIRNIVLNYSSVPSGSSYLSSQIRQQDNLLSTVALTELIRVILRWVVFCVLYVFDCIMINEECNF